MSARAFAAAVLGLAMLPDAAWAQKSAVPPSAMPGRERQQLLDGTAPATPRIQLQDGRPAPVVTTKRPAKPPKRKKRRR